jgi:guanyl-specific ribonuclease Sa
MPTPAELEALVAEGQQLIQDIQAGGLTPADRTGRVCGYLERFMAAYPASQTVGQVQALVATTPTTPAAQAATALREVIANTLIANGLIASLTRNAPRR